MNKYNEKSTTYKPFLRWAGGKRWLTKNISNYLPEKFNNYYEPFLGGGSIFIYLKANGYINEMAYLSDANKELINSYEQLVDNTEIIVKTLSTFENSKEEYYRIRSSKPKNKLDEAIRFIYLNRTSFNGLYRVNKKGEYNVPYGHRDLKDVFGIQNLQTFSEILKNKVTISHQDFFNIGDVIQKGDLVFLDPPYTVAHENNGFIQYNQQIFHWNDQVRIRELLLKIIEKEAYYILTNAKHDSIENLFQGVGKQSIENRHSNIGGKGASRQSVKEYIFTNI